MPHHVNEASRLHLLTVKAMTAMKIALSAKNYMVFYYIIWDRWLYRENIDPTFMVRQLKLHVRSRYHEIHTRFFDHEQQVNSIRNTCERIDKVLKAILPTIGDANIQTCDYSGALTGFEERLVDNDAFGSLRDIFDEVMGATKDIRARVDSLQSNLEKTIEDVQDIEEKFDVVNGHDSGIDELTSMPNRRSLENVFTSFTKNSEPARSFLSLLMVDIDDFTAFNKKNGENIGNKALIIVADLLIRHTKGNDFVARHSNDQFAILLPNTDQKGAKVVADQILKAVSGKRMTRTTTQEDLGRITLSGGSALYRPGEDFQAFADRANAYLDKAKRLGGNKTLCQK